jgi:putative FmdB family regulatory protein
MPTYVYRCGSCQRSTELVQRFSDSPLTVCPHCGGPLQRLLFPPAIIFKGSGWYATDHKSPSGGNGGKTGSATTSEEGAPAAGSAKEEGSTVAKKTSAAEEV